MRKFTAEFKEFISKGNVIDLAVGVIIGAAFQGVVTSLTENILSPLIGLIAGQNFDSLQLQFLGVTIKYGAFITSLVNFFLMAFVIFLIVKGMNTLRNRNKPAVEEKPQRLCPYCMSEVHDNAQRCPSCTSQLNDQNLSE